MKTTATAALVPLVSRRFHSFAEAAEVSLGDLTRSLPGTVVLGQLDADERSFRLTDVRGEEINGIRRNASLPLAESLDGAGARPDSQQPEQWLDPQALLSLGIESWLTLPLELSNGSVVGLICGFSEEPDAYLMEHGVLLAVAARLLGYEWEEVLSRAELRKLRQQVLDGAHADPETGLANRRSFLEQLEREHSLAKRGTHNTCVLVCRVSIHGRHNGDLTPTEKLALKDVAAVLTGVIRATDHLGRIAPMALGVGLVGVDNASETAAFVRRFEQALERATHSRAIEIEVAYGHSQLVDEDSAESALAAAEEAAEPEAGP